MDALNAAAALISLAALFSWLNHRYIRQPASIALLLFSLALSLALVALGKLHIGAERYVQQAIAGVQLDRALLDSMLSFLLFAGALQVDLRELARRKWAIGFLASLGGLVANRMLAAINSYKVEILLTLAVVMGGYALALALRVSGPIAIVVAGMLIGTLGRRHAMSAHSRERLDDFWELLDEIMNAVLFVMVGLELLRLEFDRTFAWAAALAVPAVLAARFVSVGIGALLPGLRAEFPPRVVALLTWGGLRGGISVALALALPASPHRDAIITVTYVVVLFSILVQGLTLSRALRFLTPRAS